MYEVNWNQFNIKNPNATTAFENMCRHLFFRKYKVGGYDFSSNYNQTGLETEPIEYEKKYIGFQCKYSSSGSESSFYKEVYDSLTKAIKTYDYLDKILVYTNLNIKPNVSDVERKNVQGEE